MSTTMADTWTAFGPYVKRGPDGEIIAGTGSAEMATQIAREHNAHAGLVEACEAALAALTCSGRYANGSRRSDHICDRCESEPDWVAARNTLGVALAAAKGDPNG